MKYPPRESLAFDPWDFRSEGPALRGWLRCCSLSQGSSFLATGSPHLQPPWSPPPPHWAGRFNAFGVACSAAPEKCIAGAI